MSAITLLIVFACVGCLAIGVRLLFGSWPGEEAERDCPRCGKRNVKHARFCAKCGAPLTKQLG